MTAAHPLCPYCTPGTTALLESGDDGYPYRSDYGPVWFCFNCGAYVGCHDGTTKPLGRLADKALRAEKVKAHAAFDPLWRAKMQRDGVTKKQARNAGYAWLAEQLGIDRDACHIGMFDVEMCRRAVAVCEPFRAGNRRAA